jgi:hypothetical protein
MPLDAIHRYSTQDVSLLTSVKNSRPLFSPAKPDGIATDMPEFGVSSPF